MMGTPLYTEFHPRWLRRRVSTYWWLEKPAYAAFILREASCVFVGWFVVYLLLLVHAIGRGESAYDEFLAWSATPAMLVLDIVSFVFVLFHAITFFQAAPQALVIHVGKRRVPSRVVRWGHYGALVATSAVVWWVLVGASAN